jgi:hypothetical protein
MSSFLKLIIKEMTRNQGCCFHTFNVPEELKSNILLLQANINLRLTLDGKICRLIRFALPESGELRIAVKAKNGVFSVCQY